jgi:low affinity Fe/Cu permease
MDNAIVWIFVAVVAVLVYLLVMRVFFRDSKDLDKKIDHSKMKPWKDDDD